MIKSPKKVTIEEPWEAQLGETVVDRIRNASVNTRAFRAAAHLPQVDPVVQKRFTDYIHKIGANVLQLELSDAKKEELDRLSHQTRTTKVARLLRHKIKVKELDEGILSIIMDQEWDTSGWPEEMIIAGCEALVLIFNDPEANVPLDRKDRAVFMLQKLIYRHDQAVKYIQRNIELMIGQAVNRRIRHGLSAGQLDLLYVLHGCRERFQNEMSVFNFTGRAHEMMLLEARLAAILIQHSYRAHLDRRRVRPIISYTESFGTAEEMKMLRESVIKTRNRDLRTKWALIHVLSSPEKRNTIGGIRGPVHVGVQYTKLMLEIILQLVSDKAGIRAASNREDVVRSNGCILLANFLACPEGPLAGLACQVLVYISRAAESFFPMLIMGCGKGCLKFLEFVGFKLLRIKSEVWKDKSSRACKDALTIRYSYIDCIQIVTMLGIHAAGILRARDDYGFVREARGDIEAVNYKHILEPFLRQSSPRDMVNFLGIPKLIRLVVSSMIEMKHLTTVQFILKCVLALACSDCHNNLLKEIMANYGKAMSRLMELLEEQDMIVSTLAMSILVQINTLQLGRAGFLSKGMSGELAKMSIAASNYNRKPYQRAMFVLVSQLRQVEWRAYDPQTFPEHITMEDSLRKAVFLDLLKTIKNPPAGVADKLSIADYVILPSDKDTSLGMSQAVSTIPAKDLSDYLCHPHDATYFLTLPWDESCGICSMFEGLSMDKKAALSMVSSSAINFLGKCLFQSRYLFTGNDLEDRQLMIVFNGVASAANALANFSLHSTGNFSNINMLMEVITDGNVTDSCSFFIDTLSVSHPFLEESLRNLQVHVGMSVVRFFDCYASMLLSVVTSTKSESETSKSFSPFEMEIIKRATEEIINLAAPGKSATKTIKTLKKVHGVSAATTDKLDRMCALLCKLTVLVPGADAALNDWKIIEALAEHLPIPLSGVGELGIHEKHFIEGLGSMPASMFELCANISQLPDGKARCLTEGYLRRALDKLAIISQHLETGRDMKGWAKDINFDKPIEGCCAFRQDAIACMKLILKLTNFTHEKFGAANDLILLDKYNITDLCVAYLSVLECPRKELLVALAIQLIGALSRDNARIYQTFVKLDMMNVVRAQLLRIEEMSAPLMGCCVETITNFASGYRTPYMTHVFPLLREPLIKVNRIFPELRNLVSDCNWAMTKVTSSAALEEPMDDFDIAVEDFIRGKTDKVELKLPHLDHSLLSREAPNTNVSFDGRNTDLNWTGMSYSDDTLASHRPGSYFYCGVSACGSLRLPISGSKDQHGHTASLSEDAMEAKLLDLSSTFPNNLCDVSLLSAREKELQELIESRKLEHGFIKKKFDKADQKSLPNIKILLTGGSAPPSTQSLKIGANKANSLKKAKSMQYNYNTGAKTLGQSPMEFSKPLMNSTSVDRGWLSPMKTVDVKDCPELLMTRPPPNRNKSGLVSNNPTIIPSQSLASVASIIPK